MTETFDSAGLMRLRMVRGGMRGGYVVELGTSHDVVATVRREPLHWWDPVLRMQSSPDLEPGRFVVESAGSGVRCVIVRPGGTLRAGRLDLTAADGSPIGRMHHRHMLGLGGYELRDPLDVLVGSVEPKPNPRSIAYDAYGHEIATLETILLRSGIAALGLGRIEGVQRPQSRLQTSDVDEVGTMLTFAPIATPTLRLMTLAAAVHYRS